METFSVSYSATHSHTAVKDTDKVHAKKAAGGTTARRCRQGLTYSSAVLFYTEPET